LRSAWRGSDFASCREIAQLSLERDPEIPQDRCDAGLELTLP
jgi:hypothetical protein